MPKLSKEEISGNRFIGMRSSNGLAEILLNFQYFIVQHFKQLYSTLWPLEFDIQVLYMLSLLKLQGNKMIV